MHTVHDFVNENGMYFRGFFKIWYFDYSTLKDFDMTIIHGIEIAYII